ncbi:hypothetical protein N7468_007082 [Penicillium chermesinum]|uniref:Uncharacterized protein n=1 Tax=Penicillium chermesinum TaxID=63820 RepID=A0A9W9TK71_9EURO|nr:uncharacterized protein N7468_007082 [Penicillium chermesinum]KAJ5225857.1 hypothetical protein N7468_007082 [Penicillium chermesinum]KAJ6160938.1 hypothetical protein N7470_004334 [Penicillium chermesinum]
MLRGAASVVHSAMPVSEDSQPRQDFHSSYHYRQFFLAFIPVAVLVGYLSLGLVTGYGTRKIMILIDLQST